MKIEFVAENDGIRLSEELKLHVSRKLYKHIKGFKAKIYVNGVLTETYKTINKGDNIVVDYVKEFETEWPIYESKLDIKYEDDNYLVVKKRGGLLTIPTKANPKSLYQELLYYFMTNNLEPTVSILNRLDKETQGLVLIAKNPIAADKLQPTHLHMTRKYLCMCHGIFEKKSDRIILKIRRSDDSNKRIISEDGQEAISNYKVIEEINGNSLVEFLLETGRTHQIRVTTKYLNHPILGDSLYGDDNLNVLHLYSYYLSFINPYTNEKIEITDRDIEWLK